MALAFSKWYQNRFIDFSDIVAAYGETERKECRAWKHSILGQKL